MKGWIKGKLMAHNAGVKQKNNIENISGSLILYNNHAIHIVFKEDFASRDLKVLRTHNLVFTHKGLGR